MIVTCPKCSARYKINESKIKGRGAKITCPRCSHRFVVYRDQSSEVPDNVGSLDFRTVGITWRVRKGVGVTYNFHDLATLHEFIQDGQVDKWDQLSFDNRTWQSIDQIESLEAHFWEIFQKARRGEIDVEEEVDEEDEEDESDAPTTIVGRGSSLASEIRDAVLDSTTPGPSSHHDEDIEGHLVHEDEEEEEDEVDVPDQATELASARPELAAAIEEEAKAEGASQRASEESEPKKAPPKAAPAPAPAPASPQTSEGGNGGKIALAVVGVLILGALAAGAAYVSGAFS